MAPIAPLAAHSATITPTANAIAEADLFWAASFFARSIMLITPWGATEPTKCSSELKAPAPNKPAPSAPAATSGRFERSLRLMSVTSAMPPRRFSTAPASCSRSASMSPRTCSGVRPLGVAIALQRLRGQSCFLDRLLRQRRGRLADHRPGQEREQRSEPEQNASSDQEGQPGRHRRREPSRDRREDEREREHDEQKRARTQPDPDPELGDLLLELEDRELELEPRKAARVLGDLLSGRPDAGVGLSLAGGHVPSNRLLL